jgi:activator of HSP90 ATPase
MKLKTDNIFQITELEAVPSRVYQALMNSQEHAAFTGMEVTIDPQVGGVFETFDHEASGMFLDLEKDKRIVQSWRHTEFPAGFYSVVHIDLEPTEKGTRVNFNHIGVPEESSGWLTEAWKKVYWNRLKDFLDEKVLH